MNPEHELVNQISRWLAGHSDNTELLGRIGSLGKEGLSLEQAQALDELVAELSRPERRTGQLQMVARETLEALALG